MKKPTKPLRAALAAATFAALLSGCAATEIHPFPGAFPPERKPATVSPKPDRDGRPSPMPVPLPADAPSR